MTREQNTVRSLHKGDVPARMPAWHIPRYPSARSSNMPQINSPTSGHTGPAAVAGFQWLPYGNTTYLARLQHAVAVINTRVNGDRPCDAAFRALPGGRSFAQVWADPSVWISYDPGSASGRYGATLGNEVTISQYCCRMGMWTIVATLIHELAHVNGAAGTNHAAEQTLQACLMKAHHDPTIIGQLQTAPRDPVLAAMSRARQRVG